MSTFAEKNGDKMIELNNNRIFISSDAAEISVKDFPLAAKIDEIYVETGNPFYRSEGNCLLTKDGRELVLGASVVSIPNGVVEIRALAFAGRIGLTSVSIPSSVHHICSQAFINCPDLTRVELNEGLDYIGSFAFKNCKVLKSIMFPDSLVTLGDSVFEGCGSLTNVNIPKNLVAIDNNVFKDCLKLKTLTVSEDNPQYAGIGNCCIKRLGVKLFIGCTGSVISNKVKFILKDSFYGTDVRELIIPEGVVDIDLSAFRCCHKLRSITIPASVKKLHGAIHDCPKLEEIIIGRKDIPLKDYYFSECKNARLIFSE